MTSAHLSVSLALIQLPRFIDIYVLYIYARFTVKDTMIMSRFLMALKYSLLNEFDRCSILKEKKKKKQDSETELFLHACIQIFEIFLNI